MRFFFYQGVKNWIFLLAGDKMNFIARGTKIHFMTR